MGKKLIVQKRNLLTNPLTLPLDQLPTHRSENLYALFLQQPIGRAFSIGTGQVSQYEPIVCQRMFHRMMDNSSSPERMYILLISNQLQNIVL